MSDFLSRELREQLGKAVNKSRRAKATRSVHIGGQAFAIYEMSEEGFSVTADDTPSLRGLIDIYEGPRHLYQALIVAAERHGDMVRYDFKRNTLANANAPKDFAFDARLNTPALPKR